MAAFYHSSVASRTVASLRDVFVVFFSGLVAMRGESLLMQRPSLTRAVCHREKANK